MAAGWPERLEAGEVTQHECAGLIGSRQSSVHRWFKAWQQDRKLADEQSRWERSAEAQASIADFEGFRERYFTDEWGQPYVTAPFHRRWIESILEAMEVGGRVQILSPPRHGKTQLLIHFCVWLIVRRPNIRIMWVGLNEDNAKEAVGAVVDILENHVELVEDVLGPGRDFKPPARSGKAWTASVATVGNREGTGIKSPTIRAIGKGGKLLSKDADLIVLDDVQDQDSVWSPASRDRDRHWINTQVSSRKEAHTAIAKIGSRQHHLDLDGELITNPSWSSLVERSHDPECGLPVHEPREGHTADCPDCAIHQDCVLWPGKRTMAFLQDQRAAMQDDVVFEMVYQNITRADGAEYVTVEHLRRCRNEARRIGDVPVGTMLIAGLDPATSGFQAAMLWAFDPETKRRHLVDLDNRRAGGLPGAEEIIKLWHAKYGLKTWVVESMYFQDAIRQHVPIVDFAAKRGIVLNPHITDRWNKFNRDFGVTAQFALFKNDPPLIDLPYGDAQSIDRVRAYEQQVLNFEPVSGKRTRRPTDLVMAGWFPETQIRLWLAEMSAEIEDDRDMAGYTSLRFGDSYASGLGELVNQ